MIFFSSEIICFVGWQGLTEENKYLSCIFCSERFVVDFNFL